MQKIKVEDFQKELQQVDPRLMIVPNQNRPGASNLFLNGVDICSWIPQFEIQDEATPDYVYRLNDMPIPFKTTVQIIEIAKGVLGKLEDKDYADALFDTPQNIEEVQYGEHHA